MNSKIIPKLFPGILILLSVINQSHALEMDDLDSYLYPKTEKTISMNFTNATLDNVLKIFSQQSGLNFIVSTDIASKTVNLYLDNVPVEEALERILSAHNLAYEITPGSNIFTVKALQTSSDQLMTRIYPLKFATVPSSQLFSTLSGEGGESVERNTGSTGIIAAVSAVLSQIGTVVEDTRTNSLIVSDIPIQFPLIENTIMQLDIRIPQILIEAEILDISTTLAEDMGVKFGNPSFAQYAGGPTRNLVYPFNPDKLITDDTPGLFVKEYTAGTLSFPALEMTLDFLRSHTDTKSIARPSILTLNNSMAEIKIITDEAIGIVQNTTSSEGTSSQVREAERVETGVSLKVTPQANIHTREIIMAIEPKVTQATIGGTFDGQTFLDPESRGMKSILRIHDGDTIVLGGLLRTEKTTIRVSIPILGDIPIIGAPFRHKEKDEDQRELIIFITPHILDEDVSLKTALLKPKKIIREQSVSSNRTQTIEKDLLRLEKKYFNAYK